MRGLLTVLLIALAAAAVATESSPPAALSPELQTLAAEARFGAEIPVILTFADHIDPRRFQIITSAHERRYRMVRALKEQSQDGMRSAITVYLRLHGATDLKPLWLSNSLAATVPATLLSELARWPIIVRIRFDAVVEAPTTIYDATTKAEWNLRAVRAPEVWGLGYLGQGVTVAILDTGVDMLHPDLRAQYRGGTNSWYDPYGEHVEPFDAAGHGTQVAGVLLGRNSSGSAIGLAPGAQWIAAKVFDDSQRATLSAMHQAFQWLLDPDGNPATNDAPDVVNASWGLPGVPCAAEFDRDIEALKTAGIAIVFAAGNDGPGSSTTVTPGNGPGVLSVGAVDDTEAVASFSSRGPSACDSVIDPEVVAPGVAVFTADLSYGISDGAYVFISGSSIAAPHVSGTMALLRSVRPDLTVAELESIVRSSARDLGAAGPDNDTGYGMLDAFAAVSTLTGEAPVAVADTATTAEDTPVTINVLANDRDPQGVAPTLAAVASPSVQGGAVVRNASGTLTYTPPADFFGDDSFTYVASDGRYTGVGRVSVTVTPVNDAPLAVDDAFMFTADPVTGLYAATDPGVLANDRDPDGNAFTVALVANVAAGSVQLQPGGGFIYTPPASGVPSGPLSFTYRLSDGTLTSNPATVSFTLNRAPVARDDTLLLAAPDANGRYSAVIPGILANDADADNDPMGASLVTNVAQGSVQLLPGGGFTYTPPVNGVPDGALSFTYRLSDGKSLSNVATVTFTVNRPPSAVDDRVVLNATVNSGPYLLAAPGVLANDTDADGNALTPVLLTNVSLGSVTLTLDGGLVYTPPPEGGVPEDELSFTYRVNDGHAVSNAATVTFNVIPPVNAVPIPTSAGIAAPINNPRAAAPAASPFTPTSTWDTSSWDEPNVQEVESTQASASAAAAARAGKAAAARDEIRGTKDEESTLVANDDDFTLDDTNSEGQYVVEAPGVLTNDDGGAKLTATLARNVRTGRIALRADGGFTYTPPASGIPEDELSFTYRVNDGTSVSRTATATITFRHLLVANPDTFVLSTRDRRGEYVSDAPGVLANDTGPGRLRALLVQDVTTGQVKLAPDGGFTYVPSPQGTPKGPLSFVYKVSNGTLTSGTATVVFTVPTPLAANADTFVLAAPGGKGRYVLQSPGVLANDTGNGALTAILARNVKTGRVTLSRSGGFIYVPPASGRPAGPLSFSYKVSDGKNTSEEAQVTFTLRTAPPTPPRATPVSGKGVERGRGQRASRQRSAPSPVHKVLK